MLLLYQLKEIPGMALMLPAFGVTLKRNHLYCRAKPFIRQTTVSSYYNFGFDNGFVCVEQLIGR